MTLLQTVGILYTEGAATASCVCSVAVRCRWAHEYGLHITTGKVVVQSTVHVRCIHDTAVPLYRLSLQNSSYSSTTLVRCRRSTKSNEKRVRNAATCHSAVLYTCWQVRDIDVARYAPREWHIPSSRGGLPRGWRLPNPAPLSRLGRLACVTDVRHL